MENAHQALLEALKQVKYPGFSRDIVSFGLIKQAHLNDGQAVVRLELTTRDPAVPTKLKAEVEAALNALPGVGSTDVQIAVSAPKAPPPGAPGQAGAPSQMQKVKHVIAVASGKGGVGKSTFAVNLACALRDAAGGERRIGLMDCDIYGPSIPLMIGVRGRPELADDLLLPLENFGIKVMSMGLLIDEDTPVVWRGPMVVKTIQQFTTNVDWGELDILVVDLPPGTGDAHLTLAQTIPLEGALIVTTPQQASVSVARRGAIMFEKVSVPLLGVAENMSYLTDAQTGARLTIFGEGGGRKAAEALKTPFLGEVPLDPAIREGGDRGIPVVVGHPDSPASLAFYAIAEKILNQLTPDRQPVG